MQPKTARTFLWLAGILIVLGFLIMSPGAGLILFLLAAASAAVPSIFAADRSRLVPVGLFVLSAALAVIYYPSFKREQEAYAARAKARMEKQKAVAPAEQAPAKK